MNLYEHKLSTQNAQQMIKVTHYLRQDIAESGIDDGIAIVFSPHTTAGFTINENADPAVVHDVLMAMEEAFPTRHLEYRHLEGNSHAHIKTTCFGPSQTIIIHDGAPILGIWQDVYFCEFDGPRERHFYIRLLEG